MITSSATVTWVLVPARQAAEGGSGIPWWIWLILISVLLLLLLIGLVLQSRPGQPIPGPGEGARAPSAADETIDEEDGRVTPSEPDETNGEK